jgi:hypothetical protein
MKFIKRLNFNPHRPLSNQLTLQASGKIVTDTVASLQLPSGTTSQRVQSYVNGQIRYNKTINEIEAYVNGTWEIITTRRQGNITFQNIATGNYVSTIFGPLPYRVDPTKPANVLVLVENVVQIPTVNYTLVNDPIVTKATVGVTNPGVTALNISDKLNLIPGMSVSGDVSIAPGTTIQSISTVSSQVLLSSATLGTIQAGVQVNFAYSTGTYVTFTSAPPTKPIYTLSGFDGYYPPFEQ